MNRLDRHIGMVRSKLALEQFLFALGYAIAIFFAAVLVSVLIDRVFWVHLPKAIIWFWAGMGAAILAAFGYAIARQPTAHQAATFIDDKLGLKEKFSTALFVRSAAGDRDPFALAAVLDANQTADNVSLHRRFPLSFPSSLLWALGTAAVVLSLVFFLPRFDLFGRKEKLAIAQHKLQERQEAQAQAQSVMTAINSMPASVQNQQKVELAKKEVERVMDQPTIDPVVVKDTARKAEEEAEAARQEEVKNNQAYAQAQADKAVFDSVNPSADDKGPVADASRDLANADFAKAIDKLQGLPDKFKDMTPEQQKQATQQMAKLADQLKKIADDPAAMQHLQQQLQQQGVNQQQAQQIAKAMQQAVQGNPQAQQQLQQMQQQLTQQMNGGKGPTQQQQQQIQKAMQQMQSVASSQSKASQMTSAAQQMVQGMQAMQAAQQGGSKAGQQQANAKMANAQQGGSKAGGQQSSGQQGQQGSPQASAQQSGSQPGGSQPNGQQSGQQGQQPGQQSGQQPGSQQANGGQPGGSQPGQGPGQNGQQQMQQAGQQMAQALGQMDAVQKDAEQQQVAQNNPNPQNGTNPGSGQGKGQGNHQQGNNPGGNPGNGAGGPGPGGGQDTAQSAPFSVKQEMDASQNIDNGKILAKSFVKADQLIGKSTIQLSPAAKAAVKESTDDVSEESVPKDSQKVVKDYFDTVQN